jgi:hypothetical protein
VDAVLAAAQARARALVARDWDSVSAQLHRRFRYVTANGQRLDRDAYLAFLADGPVRWNRQTLHDAEVVVDGRVAVLVAMVVDDVLYDGRPAQWEFVTSQTYVERSGEWLYLAGHTALPAA